jgi:transcriptional repressor NrdR
VKLPAIVKSDDRREQYEREKIAAGINRACEKRPISVDDQNAVVDRIEKQLAASLEREVSSKAVGDLVMAELKQLDEVAYLRFASVYQSFQDISDFLAEAQAVADNQADEQKGEE